jgi:hypothetical protein
MWIWPPILIVLVAVYIISYTLFRTGGDGRPGLQRLLHPSKGGVQEEHGGDGHGNPLDGYGPQGASELDPLEHEIVLSDQESSAGTLPPRPPLPETTSSPLIRR